MRLQQLELRRIALDLVTPFRTSFGTESRRDILLIRVGTDIGDGWGECVAMAEPAYSAEFVGAAQLVLRDHFWPALSAAGDIEAADVAGLLERYSGHPMSKAAIEAAVLDAQLRAGDTNLHAFFGGTRDRVPSGVSVGIFDSLDELLGQVQGYVDDGYARIKLKIEPGWDIEPVRLVRDLIGPDMGLQ
ncbi:MAG: o-succinylbenzoate synthase, partial [Ilumatobacter sp.]